MENTSEDSSVLLPRIASVTTPDMPIGDRVLSILDTYRGGRREKVNYSELKLWFGVPDMTGSAISGTLESLFQQDLIGFDVIVGPNQHSVCIHNLRLTSSGLLRAGAVRFRSFDSPKAEPIPESPSSSIVGLQLSVSYKKRSAPERYDVVIPEGCETYTLTQLIEMYAVIVRDRKVIAAVALDDPDKGYLITTCDVLTMSLEFLRT